jgi:putative DNA primase/helicase
VITEDKIDTELSNKLAMPQAKQAIFNWLMEGYKMLVANGGKISVSDSIKNVKENIKNESNSVRRWLFESEMFACVPEGKNDARWKPLFEWMSIYQEYCKKYNEPPKSQKSVSKVFKDMKFATERRHDGTWFCIDKKSNNVASIEPTQYDEEVPF